MGKANRWNRKLLAMALGLTLISVTTGLKQACAARKQCWTSEELAGTPSELTILKGESANPYRVKPRAAAGYERPALDERFKGLITCVPTSDGAKRVALTFDLCEGSGERAGYDGRIVDYLRRNKIPATFFMGGKWARSHKERSMQLLGDPLFETGNHSFAHARPAKLDKEGLDAEILGGEAELAALRSELARIGCLPDTAEEGARSPPPLFRFPYGEATPEALKYVNGKGLAAIQWDVAPGDPARGVTAEALAEDIIRRVRPGSIVVLHANAKGTKTADALAIAVPALKKRGYEFTTVGGLLASGKPVRE